MPAFSNITAHGQVLPTEITKPAVGGVARQIHGGQRCRDGGGVGSGQLADVKRAARSAVPRYNALQHREAGALAAVAENGSSTFRWGLIKLRQNTPTWRTGANCDKPVQVSDPTQCFSTRTPIRATRPRLATYGIYVPSVAVPNYSLGSAPFGTVVVTPAANTAGTITTILARGPNDSGALIPRACQASACVDRPIDFALADARAAAIAAMTADSAANRTCRNTIVVLITGGKDDGDAGLQRRSQYRDDGDVVLVGDGERRDEACADRGIAVKPACRRRCVAAGDCDQQRRVLLAVRRTAFDVTAAVDRAVQQAFARSSEFDTSSPSEFSPVSPIVGTVNLKNARDANGNVSAEHRHHGQPRRSDLPQRSNFLLTGGFTLPDSMASCVRSVPTNRWRTRRSRPGGSS